MMWNDDYYYEIEEQFGEATAMKVAQSHRAAIVFVERVRPPSHPHACSAHAQSGCAGVASSTHDGKFCEHVAADQGWCPKLLCGQVAKEEGIECKFKPTDGYLFPLSKDKEHVDTLDKELAAARRAGLVDVSKVAPFCAC